MAMVGIGTESDELLAIGAGEGRGVGDIGHEEVATKYVYVKVNVKDFHEGGSQYSYMGHQY